jgi:hypothetical protein
VQRPSFLSLAAPWSTRLSKPPGNHRHITFEASTALLPSHCSAWALTFRVLIKRAWQQLIDTFPHLLFLIVDARATK